MISALGLLKPAFSLSHNNIQHRYVPIEHLCILALHGVHAAGEVRRLGVQTRHTNDRHAPLGVLLLLRLRIAHVLHRIRLEREQMLVICRHVQHVGRGLREIRGAGLVDVRVRMVQLLQRSRRQFAVEVAGRHAVLIGLGNGSVVHDVAAYRG